MTYYIGDVNPIDYGGMWIEADESGFNVYKMVPLDESFNIVAECYIYRSDIERLFDDSVASYAGLDADATEFEKIHAIIAYWGATHMGGDWEQIDVADSQQWIEDRDLKQ